MWNWQKNEWPNFSWDNNALVELEFEFIQKSGIYVGTKQHLGEESKKQLIVELISDEAFKTSEIEGEILNRESLQSSIRKNFKLQYDNRRVKPAEKGISDTLTDLYFNFDKPLTHETFFSWHAMITNGRYDLKDIGCYRSHEEPMQIVSGRLDKPIIHFEAPPSKIVKNEMDLFLSWWNKTSPAGPAPLTPLVRCAIAHLYFVSIHPFEDGNGRIARVLSEKSLAECLGEPTLIAISSTIEKNRKEYYQALEENNKTTEITNWIIYFANTILSSQRYTQATIDFLIKKTKLFDKLRGLINERQEKVLNRIFKEGIEGFKGGVSAENYISITGTSRATATRDLQDLILKGAMYKTGELKSTRYYLNLEL